MRPRLFIASGKLLETTFSYCAIVKQIADCARRLMALVKGFLEKVMPNGSKGAVITASPKLPTAIPARQFLGGE